jgi:hypothetical protein
MDFFFLNDRSDVEVRTVNGKQKNYVTTAKFEESYRSNKFGCSNQLVEVVADTEVG